MKRSTIMANASIVLGVLSLTTCMIVYLSVPFGALAILFGLLSRGNSPMLNRCRAAIICGGIGLAGSLIITISAFWMLFHNETAKTEFLHLFNQYASQLGIDHEFNSLEEIFGFRFSDDSTSDRTEEESERIHLHIAEDSSNTEETGEDDTRETEAKETEDPVAAYWKNFYGTGNTDSSDKTQGSSAETVDPGTNQQEAEPDQDSTGRFLTGGESI